MRQALQDLSEEGLIQVLKPDIGSQWVVGVIGQLQLDVVSDRAKSEYKVALEFEPTPYQMARWLSSDDEKALNQFVAKHKSAIMTGPRRRSGVHGLKPLGAELQDREQRGDPLFEDQGDGVAQARCGGPSSSLFFRRSPRFFAAASALFLRLVFCFWARRRHILQPVGPKRMRTSAPLVPAC